MISGSVNPMRKPSINVVLIDGNGADRTVEAHLDTGFSDDLTLPKSAITRLGLKPTGRSNFTVGNNARATFNTYAATIRWHNGVRSIVVLESEIFPVVGVGLLWENNLSVDFVAGGDVAITELPATGDGF